MLLGEMQAADAVDELCLTVAPLMVAGDSKRVAHGPPGTPPRRMALVGALLSEDALLLRYRRSPGADDTVTPPTA
jgi:riboflavin biosynthesis pyrimidine reductase